MSDKPDIVDETIDEINEAVEKVIAKNKYVKGFHVCGVLQVEGLPCDCCDGDHITLFERAEKIDSMAVHHLIMVQTERYNKRGIFNKAAAIGSLLGPYAMAKSLLDSLTEIMGHNYITGNVLRSTIIEMLESSGKEVDNDYTAEINKIVSEFNLPTEDEVIDRIARDVYADKTEGNENLKELIGGSVAEKSMKANAAADMLIHKLKLETPKEEIVKRHVRGGFKRPNEIL